MPPHDRLTRSAVTSFLPRLTTGGVFSCSGIKKRRPFGRREEKDPSYDQYHFVVSSIYHFLE